MSIGMSLSAAAALLGLIAYALLTPGTEELEDLAAVTGGIFNSVAIIYLLIGMGLKRGASDEDLGKFMRDESGTIVGALLIGFVFAFFVLNTALF